MGFIYTLAWMDFFSSGSEIEHETSLATCLAMIGFSPIGLVIKFVFLIVVHLAAVIFYFCCYYQVAEKMSVLYSF